MRLEATGGNLSQNRIAQKTIVTGTQVTGECSNGFPIE